MFCSSLPSYKVFPQLSPNVKESKRGSNRKGEGGLRRWIRPVVRDAPSALHSPAQDEKASQLNRMTMHFGTLRIFSVSDTLFIPLISWSCLFGLSVPVKHSDTKSKQTVFSIESPVIEQRLLRHRVRKAQQHPPGEERGVPSSPLFKC